MGLDEQMQRLRESLGEPPSQPASQPPTVEEVMARVRAEVARRRGQPQADGLPAAIDETPAALPRWAPAAGRLAYRSEYRLDELLAFADLDFIDQCYRIVLRRPPDDGGLKHYLGLLRSDALSKVEVLGQIRFSPEGMQRGVHVDGLLLPYTVQRWGRKPIIGPLLRWLGGVLGLGAIEVRQQQLDAARARDLTEAGQVINRMAEQMEAALAHQSAALRSVQGQAAERATKAEEAIQSLHAGLTGSNTCLATLLQELKRSDAAWREQATQLRGEASVQQQAVQARSDELGQKLVALLQELKRSDAAWREQATQLREQATQLRGEASVQQQAVASRTDVLDETVAAILARQQAEDEAKAQTLGELDAVYADFEEHFRGSRELIMERARPYLDWVREAGAGSEEAPVLDLGCGRGEWLELLRDEQLHGSGVDLNRIFVDACHSRGLVVAHADVLQALKALPPKGVGAITAMHLVEHLPFEVLMALLEESRRVLRPGGLLLLETPNPENLIVGSCTFYTDPTHRNPIPPDALRWLVESRGFRDARIIRLHQHRDVPLPERVPDDQPGAATLNAVAERFAEAPDYAIRAVSP